MRYNIIFVIRPLLNVLLRGLKESPPRPLLNVLLRGLKGSPRLRPLSNVLLRHPFIDMLPIS